MSQTSSKSQITTAPGASVRILDAEASYGIFLYDTEGNIALISDWGEYATSFRAFGNSFPEFLANTNTEYLVGKLAPRRGKESRAGNCLRILIGLFIQHMKEAEDFDFRLDIEMPRRRNA